MSIRWHNSAVIIVVITEDLTTVAVFYNRFDGSSLTRDLLRAHSNPWPVVTVIFLAISRAVKKAVVARRR